MSPIPFLYGSPREPNISLTGGHHSNDTEMYLYLEHDYPWMVLTALIIGAAAVIGSLGNILTQMARWTKPIQEDIILAVLMVKPLRTTGNVFVLNLALADMVVTVLIDPFNVVGAVAGRRALIENPTLCDWIASFCSPACMSSMWNMCAISLNRYVLICKPHLYPQIFTFRFSITCCICIWIMAHLFHLPNHTGWGAVRFNPEYYICTFDILTHSYAIFYIFMGVLIPLIGVLFGYLHIFLKVRSVKLLLRVHQHAIKSASAAKQGGGNLEEVETKVRRPKKPGFTQDDVKLAKTLFAAFLVFLLCWLPFALLVLAHDPAQVPNVIYVIAIIMAHGNSAVNPILYGMTNEKFRDGYRNVLHLTKKTVAPENTSMNAKRKRNTLSADNFTTHSHAEAR